jgi:hypothetical protein
MVFLFGLLCLKIVGVSLISQVRGLRLLMVERVRVNEVAGYEMMELGIVLEGTGNYRLMGFSIKQLRALLVWHKVHHLPMRWSVSEDGKKLFLG